jgi:Zn-dependent peptidase ImmA (M78 family)
MMNPKREAINFLEELGVNSLPIVPKKICTQLDILCQEKVLNTLDGVLILDQSLHGAIIVNSLIQEEGRKSFTVAHELGHYCMDSMDSKEFQCSRGTIGPLNGHIPEQELRANEFAAELLMPEFIYKKLVSNYDPGWDTIRILADTSQTSLLATVSRFIELTDESCALIISEGSGIKRFVKSKSFDLYIDMDSRLVPNGTPTYFALHGEMVDDRFESVRADNWVTNRNISKFAEVLEWALPMNSYGQVLTLIYDEENIAESEEDDSEQNRSDDEVWPWEPPTFHKSRRKR